MSAFEKMRAVIVKSPGGPEQLEFSDWQKPKPGRQEILVAVKATALNRADLLQRQGNYPPPPGESPVLGLEMAGEVVAMGEDVQHWKLGDRVCGLLGGGGYAEYAIIHKDMALPVPQGMPMEAAAAIPEVFLTAFQALNWLARFQEGEWILIHAGASGVGTAAIQLAREMKAGGIIVTASAGKHAICRELGADHAIDYKKKDFKEAVLDIGGTAGVDVVIDFIAAPYFQRNLDILNFDGRLILLALMGGVHPESVHLAPLLQKRLQVIGSTLRSRSLDYKIRLSQDLYAFAWNHFQAGRLKPIVDRVYPWQEVADAHRFMEANRNKGKLVLKVD